MINEFFIIIVCLEGGEIYVWDINERTCLHRAIDDGCLAGSRISVSPSGQYLATGSKQGVVNVYDMNEVMAKKTPAPLKVILNLVTSITSLKFNPTSEILSMSSDEAENAFKMLHFPSTTIFSNFPTFRTQMWKPIDVDFSPSGGYLGITNNKGSAYLYRLKHYGNYWFELIFSTLFNNVESKQTRYIDNYCTK